MPGPFYNNIKGTTAGTPGTGAFTPNAASTGFLAWSTVPTGWVGMVKFDDGSAWELQYSYWNGTTLSRSATAQFVSSSTGSALTLTSAATASLIMDGNDIAPDLCSYPARGYLANINASTTTALGISAATASGTAATGALAATNALTHRPRVQYTSATTAAANAGLTGPLVNLFLVSAGWFFTAQFGASALPTGPRLFVGGTDGTPLGGDPSANTQNVAAFAKDVADTNIQFMSNSAAGTCTKIDTGIALVANGWYEATIWQEPGSTTLYFLLVRIDTGAIYYGSTATDVPASSSGFPACLGSVGTTTGTAIVFHVGHVLTRTVT